MVDNHKLDNNLLSPYVVETVEQGDGSHRQVVHIGSSDAAGGGGGSGTEYTEDAAAAANPVGGAQILVRSDTPATVTSTDGDNIARRGTNYGAAYSQIVDSSGNYVDTFGGGAQYTEGDSDASITGTVSLMEVAADTLQPIQGTVADGLLVNLGANNDITGTVTANLGATDNAVLDAIAAATAATQAAVEGTLTVTGGGGGTEYTEDVATANPIVGTATLIERDDALTTVTPVEGDWIALRGTAEGALWTQDFNSDAILADTTSIDGKITACDTGAVVVSSSALPSGASTSANQSTIIGHVDGIETTLGTIAGDTTSIDGKITACNTGAVVISSGTVTANLSATDNAVLDAIVANQLPDGHNVTVDNASIAVTAAALPLPSGAATSAAQLPDGHNVTIDNASGASAVNIQDGGNSITVDGAVVVSGTVTVGSHDVTNAGTFATQVTSSADQTGATTATLISASSTNATSTKASAGKLYGYALFNANVAARYVKFYNKASAPTVGTDVPVLTILVPAGGGANLDIPVGLNFSLGIAFATTTGAAVADTGAVAASEIIVNIWYK